MFSAFAETSALVYTGVRTLVALLLALSAVRHRAALASALGQGGSDAACIVFLLAYLDYDLRDVVRPAVPFLLAYVLLWEARALVVRVRAEQAEGEGDPGAAAAVLWPARLLYEMLMVLPPVVAGAFIVFDLVFPRQWPFPNPPAALRCEPDVVAHGDGITLRMAVPHGGELGVFTPDGRFLYVVELASGSTPVGQRFERRERLRLRVATAVGRERPGGPLQRVFGDSGSYTFRVSEPAEVSASLTCRVRYLGRR